MHKETRTNKYLFVTSNFAISELRSSTQIRLPPLLKTSPQREIQ